MSTRAAIPSHPSQPRLRGLYAILDVQSLERLGLSPVAFGRALLEARPAVVQVRDKASGAARTLELLRALVPLASEAGVPLVANDRPDLALLAGCAGVHVGQDDLPPTAVRALGPDLLLGLSTHTPAELEASFELRLDYVAIGPIFATGTKADHAPVVGLDGLAASSRRARDVRPERPLVAIGGLGPSNLEAVSPLVEMVAMVGALLPAPGADLSEVRRRTEALHARILESSGRPHL